MAISYEPGDEIRLELPSSKRAFYSKALSWRDQKKIAALSAEIKKMDSEEGQLEAVLSELAKRITRTDPVMEISADMLEQSLDFRQIYGLFAAMQFNMTYEEKKS